MSLPRAARDPLVLAPAPPGPSDRRRGTRLAAALACAALVLPHAPVLPQPVEPPTAQAHPGELLIATVRVNGVGQGEFTLLHPADGDFWLPAADLQRLKLVPLETAARAAGPDRYYSLRALGATELRFDEAELALDVLFPSHSLKGTHLDLSNRPQPIPVSAAPASLILSYRLSTRAGTQAPRQVSLESDLNVRVGPLLLRQEVRLESGTGRRFTRGATQAVYDDLQRGNRWIAGDVVSSAGAYGSVITGAGVMVSRLYDLTPDVLRQPTASLRTSTVLPAQVELSVDGSTLYRASVGPGPIAMDNLLLYGGARNVRMTVTDISGRREVVEQPFFFTDSVLARGLHEFSYFLGRRSELGANNRWRYREAGWQAWHRYGLTDYVTVAAGGEGSGSFASGGAGATLRSDRWGLWTFDALASTDRRTGASARGASARYTYLGPDGSLVIGHRRFDEAFRTFANTALATMLRQEWLAGASWRQGATTFSAELAQARFAGDRRDTATLRVAHNVSRSVTLGAELQSVRTRRQRDWRAAISLRAYFDAREWLTSTAGVEQGLRSVSLETGSDSPIGEGFGWRAGVDARSQAGGDSVTGSVLGTWNLRPATLEAFGTSQLRGGRAQFAEVAVAGSLVGIDGTWGLTRRVTDSFLLARLGVPQPGVEVLLNNQPQGRTDEQGQLLIPGVGAFSRQDVAVDESGLPMNFNLPQRRRTILPSWRSGTVVDFDVHRVQAVAGTAWLAAGGQRRPIGSHAWTLSKGSARLQVETGPSGDFYLENAPSGRWSGRLQVDGRAYACRMTVPESQDVVQELKEGIVCE